MILIAPTSKSQESSHYGTEQYRCDRVSSSEGADRALGSNVRLSAGVAGLTTALLLSKTHGHRVVVAAKHMPGDYDIEYASPWAGANYMP